MCPAAQIDPINREDFDTVCGDQTPVCCKYNVVSPLLLLPISHNLQKMG